MASFEEDAVQYAALNVNANDYLRSVLVKALGEERANNLLDEISETRETTTGIETLNFMEPQMAADIIRDEHPQIIATILVHLKRGQAADILALFDEKLRNDVMLRIATFGGVQPSALAELTEVLNNLLDGQNLKRSKMGGVRTAAEIINLMKSQQKKNMLSPQYAITTANWHRKLSTKCSCSKTLSISTTVQFSAFYRKWNPNRGFVALKVAIKNYAIISSICRSVLLKLCVMTWRLVDLFACLQVEAEQKQFCLLYVA